VHAGHERSTDPLRRLLAPAVSQVEADDLHEYTSDPLADADGRRRRRGSLVDSAFRRRAGSNSRPLQLKQQRSGARARRPRLPRRAPPRTGHPQHVTSSAAPNRASRRPGPPINIGVDQPPAAGHRQSATSEEPMTGAYFACVNRHYAGDQRPPELQYFPRTEQHQHAQMPPSRSVGSDHCSCGIARPAADHRVLGRRGLRKSVGHRGPGAGPSNPE